MKMIWYDDALSFIESYGVDPQIIEAAALHPQHVSDDPKTVEVGYPIRRLRRGDIEVVVGYRDEDEPAILFVRLHTPDEPSYGGSGKPGGTGKKAPSTMRGLRQEIINHGYKIEHGGRHDRVLRKDGTFVMPLAITPSSPTTIPNTYAQFLRSVHEDKTRLALDALSREVQEGEL